MTLNEIAYNIKNIVEGGISGEDSNMSLSQIKHMIHYHRAQLLLKYTDSGRFVSDVMFQVRTMNVSGSIGNVDILGFPNNRAIKELYIRKNTGTIEENPKFNLPIINDADREFFEASRFAPNRNQFFATYANRTIRIFDNDSQLFNDTSYQAVLTAIFENPSNLSGFSDSANVYPIPTELIASLVENVLAKEFNLYLRVNSDIINNSIDETGVKMAKPQVKASPNAKARSRKARTR